MSQHSNSQILEQQYGSEDDQSQQQPKTLLRDMSRQDDAMLSQDLFKSVQYKPEQTEEFKQTYAQYMDHPIAQQPRPTAVYDMIMNKFYKGENKIAWPHSVRRKIVYIILVPLTHLQWISIPNPMRKKDGSRENLYPVTLFMSMLWIWLYSGIIVWFTFDLTVAFNWHFNVLPMVLYPFGIAMRDYKKKVNLEQAMAEFSIRLKDQKLSLAETFSAQIFQITGLMGLTWTLYISFAGVEYVSFINESI